MKKHFLTITTLAFGALVLITNCKKKEDSPAPATTTTTGGTTSGTTSGTTTSGTTTSGATTSGTTSGSTTSGTTEVKVNSMAVNGEDIQVTSVSFVSGRVDIYLGSNNQDLSSIFIWFPLANTANGIQVPELTTYNVIENSFGGYPTNTKEAVIHLKFKSDVGSHLYSTKGGTVEVVNDSESYRNFKISNVSFKRLTTIIGNANSGPKGDVTLNATFSLNPFSSVEKNKSEAALGTWNLNGKIFNISSDVPSGAKTEISAEGVSYISNSGRTDLTVKAVNSNTYFTVKFKSNIGVVTDGTYPVVNKDFGINDGECVLVLTGNFDAPNAGNAEGFISENKGGSVVISTNASGERFVKFHNVMVTSNISTQKYLPVSGYVKIKKATTLN